MVSTGLTIGWIDCIRTSAQGCVACSVFFCVTDSTGSKLIIPSHTGTLHHILTALKLHSLVKLGYAWITVCVGDQMKKAFLLLCGFYYTIGVYHIFIIVLI